MGQRVSVVVDRELDRYLGERIGERYVYRYVEETPNNMIRMRHERWVTTEKRVFGVIAQNPLDYTSSQEVMAWTEAHPRAHVASFTAK